MTAILNLTAWGESTYLALAYLPTALIGLAIGGWIGWTQRGRWDAHKAEAKIDEGEQP